MAKKLLIILTAAAALVLPIAALAQDASDTISLPPNFIDNIWAQATLLFNSFSSYTNMIIGVVLALTIIGELVALLRNPNK